MSSGSWPALAGLTLDPPAVLDCQRAVWGKAHGAASDYRWLARSAGFGPLEAKLERAITLGSEDRPRPGQCWRAVEGSYLAVGLYPSRATDAAGRTGFLEKQILQWRPKTPVPAAAAALLLLPEVAALDDSIWWGQAVPADWARPAFSISLAEAELPAPRLDEERLARELRQGLTELRAGTDRDALLELYRQILLGTPPCFLKPGEEPLPPRALAALLLPLPRKWADQLSIAGWVPSGRYDEEELACNWNLLALRPRSTVGAGALGPPDEERVAEWVASLLDTRLETDLDSGQVPVVTRPEIPPPAAATAPAATGRSSAALEPLPAALGPLQHLEPPPLELLPPPEPLPDRATGRLPLEPPGEGAPQPVRWLHDFATDVDRRWLEPGALRSQEWPIEPRWGELAGAWALAASRGRPPAADLEQWAVKVDLLRAAALLLAPVPATLERLGLPESGRVAALHFLPSLTQAQQGRLEGLGADPLRQILEQSLAVPRPDYRQRLESALALWANSVRSPELRDLLTEVRRRTAAS